MKKKFLFIIIVFVCVFTFIVKVNADCSVSVSSPSSAVVGSTFKVTTTVSSDVGSWYYVLSYDASKVQLVSGSTKVVGVIGDSKTNSYTFKSLKSGSTSFSIVNVDLASNATNDKCSAHAGSSSITMKTQKEIEDSYSKNNNLSSLSVEGAELQPAFDANVLEYAATLPPDTTVAKISAVVQDKTAKVEGDGDVDVIDGINKIEVVVTAQHGEKKTYIINLTVEELDPIEVTVNKKKYTVIRKEGQISEIPVGFELASIKIKDQDIACYKSDVVKLTLVALKDEDGNAKLFIYDEKNNEYQEFITVKGNSANLLIVDGEKKDFLKYFKKTSFKYNDISVNGYKLNNNTRDNFYLVYAKNLETGSKGYYLYDKKDNTFQLFNEDLLKVNDKQIEYMNYIIYALGGLLGLIILIKIFSMLSSKNQKIRKLEKKIAKLKKTDYQDEDEDEEEEQLNVKKIDDTFEIPKKSKKQKLNELKEAKRKLDQKKETYKTIFDDD